MSILEVKNITCNNILKNYTFDVPENKIITLSGANNCGKTTLIRILNRQLDYTGEIMLFKKNINEYKIEEYNNLIQLIIPLEIISSEDYLFEEILYQCNNDNILLEYISKGLKLKKFLNKRMDELSTKELILAQIAIAVAKIPKIIFIDSITTYFNSKEIKEIIEFLIQYQRNYLSTIILITTNLEESIITDQIFLMNSEGIILSGNPLEILQKDNLVNKIGLDVPFMIDLSVKLKDYDLLQEIELDIDRMIDKLWK